ncbi:MAG: short-chain dehydrogenase/reductase, partial [Ilumatobacteraceae bacterium]|nr:short-chain dehydrogenase/reductase [Ilumatobacteraceae bacterium]
MRFDGKVALITGAGSGIGREVVLRLSSEGATVFGHDLDGDRLAETSTLAGGISTRIGDVRDPAECAAAVAACVAEHGRLDILGNVAGIARSEHVLDVTVEQYRAMMAVNADSCSSSARPRSRICSRRTATSSTSPPTPVSWGRPTP